MLCETQQVMKTWKDNMCIWMKESTAILNWFTKNQNKKKYLEWNLHEPSNIYKYQQIEQQRPQKHILTQKHKMTQKDRWEY